MVDQPETSDPELAGKTPARVVPAKKAPAKRKAAAKKAPAKKAPAAAKKAGARKAPAKKKAPAAAKKAPAKKAPAKKAVAKKALAKKKAPAKKAAPKRAPTKKAAAKKAAAKETAPLAAPRPSVDRKAPAPGRALRSVASAAAGARSVIAPIVEAAAPVIPAITRPAAPAVGVPDSEPLRSGERRHDRWALCASITEDLLNDLVLMAVGEGVELEPLDTSLTLPGMGEVDVRLALTVNGGKFHLDAEDGGRARIVVTANGDVQTRSAAYDGVVQEGGMGGPMGIPTPPAPIPVRVEALVHPFVEVHDDHTVSLGLDLGEAELVSLEADPHAPVPAGVDPDAWAGILQVFGMMFGVLGQSLFASLGEHVGTIGPELGAEVGAALIELGVDPGRADVNIASGLLSFGLAASDAVEGRAQPVPIAGHRIGVGLASSVVDQLVHKLLERVAGDLPLPFDVELDLGEQRVGGRFRQSRLLPEPFPDLRSAIRTEIRPRLLRGRLELSVQAAWLELPPVLPSLFNQVAKRLGELASLAPLRVQIPARFELPIDPDGSDTIPVQIDDLRVTRNGLGVVLALV